MSNSTVNRRYNKKIIDTKGLTENDKVSLNYVECGKRSEKEKLDAKQNTNNPSISIIESLRENGQIIKETSAYVAIKAYPGGNPEKEKQSEDFTH